MTVEMHTAFLHMRKIMHLSGCSDENIIVVINRQINLYGFVPCRFGIIAVQMYLSLVDAHLVPFWFLGTFWISALTLTVVNLVLLKRVCATDWSFQPHHIKLENGNKNGFHKIE